MIRVARMIIRHGFRAPLACPACEMATFGDTREWVKELPKEAFDKPEHLTREKVEDRLKPSAGTHDDSAMGEEAISGQKRVCLIPCGH